MRFYYVLLMSLLLSTTSWGANPADSLAEAARHYVNTGRYEVLYDQLAGEFQQHISPAEWRAFLATTSDEAGEWRANERLGERDGFTVYRAVFARDTLLFELALDPQGRIAGFGLSADDPALTQLPTATTLPNDVPSSNPLRSELDQRLDTVVRAFMSRSNAVGLCVGLWRGDSVRTYGYGETAVGNGRLPTATTLFEIGSISKTFTATLLADAVLRRQLALTDPVNQYLPDSIPALQRDNAAVTLVTLSNHTSGLPRLPTNLALLPATVTNPYATYDRRALFAYLKANPTVGTKPGTTYQYSNLAVGLLGTVLEMQAGQPYEQLIQDVVAKPLALRQTKITLTDADRAALAQGHVWNKQPAANWDFLALAGAGALRSTVNDLLRYLQAMTGQGPKRLVRAMQLTQQPTFSAEGRTLGLGWHQSPDKRWWWHTGGTGGYASFAAVDVANRQAVVVLVNSSADMNLFTKALLDVLR